MSTVNNAISVQLEIAQDMTVEDLIALIIHELHERDPSITQIKAYFNGQELSDAKRSLQGLGIKEEDQIVVFPVPTNRPAQTNRPAPTNRTGQMSHAAQQMRAQLAAECEVIRQQLLTSPERMDDIRAEHPNLIAAVGDKERFLDQFIEVKRKQDQARREREQEIVYSSAIVNVAPDR